MHTSSIDSARSSDLTRYEHGRDCSVMCGTEMSNLPAYTPLLSKIESKGKASVRARTTVRTGSSFKPTPVTSEPLGATEM